MTYICRSKGLYNIGLIDWSKMTQVEMVFEDEVDLLGKGDETKRWNECVAKAIPWVRGREEIMHPFETLSFNSKDTLGQVWSLQFFSVQMETKFRLACVFVTSLRANSKSQEGASNQVLGGTDR